MIMVSEIKDEECQISLMDGSFWMINTGHFPKSVCWLPTQNVKRKTLIRDHSSIM